MEPAAATTPAPTVVTVKGALGDRAHVPTRDETPVVVQLDSVVAEELRSHAVERASVLASQREADAIEITLGGPGDDGLLIAVVADGERVERRIPPATHPAEAMTNFDHTLDAALDELGLKRRPRELTKAR